MLLKWADNNSAVRCPSHECKKSEAGRALGCLLCSLFINSPLGVNVKWPRMNLNVIEDDISRFKREPPDSSFDYSCLQSKYPQLTSCGLFQPIAELPSLIWDMTFTKIFPDLCILKNLKNHD